MRFVRQMSGFDGRFPQKVHPNEDFGEISLCFSESFPQNQENVV